jgi:hypothetical protein
MTSNRADSLKSIVPDELRVVVNLARSALAIVSKILMVEDNPILSDQFIASFHTVCKELKDWHITLTAAIVSKTCFDGRPGQMSFTDATTDEFGIFTDKINAIDLKAELHKREWDDRRQGNPRDASIPVDYSAHDTLVQLMDMLTEFDHLFYFF